MAATTNLYQDLKDALQAVKDFLDTPAVAQVSAAIKALAAIVKEVNTLIDELVTLLNKLKAEIDNLAKQAENAIPGIDQFNTFVGLVVKALNAAEQLLPAQKDSIDSVINVTNVAGSLPTIGQVKDELDKLIDDITAKLVAMKA